MAPPPTNPTPPDPKSIIRFKLSDIDSVMSTATTCYTNKQSPFVAGGALLPTVPVIRIFGATDRGKRVMAHIHGAFPYVYVKYLGGSLEPDVINTYIQRLARSLNLAMEYTTKPRKDNGKAKSNGSAGGPPPTSSPSVAFIVPCKGIPFYGYHVGYEPFLKIYITKPSLKIRLSETLRSGVIMKTKFDVFEDHAPFLLQFMLDCDLYGCGWVEVDECRFRKAPNYVWSPQDDLDPPSMTGPYHTRVYNTSTVPAELLHSSDPALDPPEPQSTCPIEIDVPIHAIMNRSKIKAREIQQDFIEYLRPLDGSNTAEEKLVLSLRELWVDERRRREAAGEPGPAEITDSTPRAWDTKDQREPMWADEPRLRNKMNDLLGQDRKDYKAQPGFLNREPDFKTFVEERQSAERVQKGFLERLRTTFEQVDAVFSSRLKEDRETAYEYGALVMCKYEYGLDLANRRGKGRAMSLPYRALTEDFDEAGFQATQADLEQRVLEEEERERIYQEEVGPKGVDRYNTQYFDQAKQRARAKQGPINGFPGDIEEADDDEDEEDAGLEEEAALELFEEQDGSVADPSPPPSSSAELQRNQMAMGDLESSPASSSEHGIFGSPLTLGDDTSFVPQAQPRPISLALDSTSPEPIEQQRTFAATFATAPTLVKASSSTLRSSSRSPTKQNLFRSPTKVVKVQRASATPRSASGSIYGSDLEEDEEVDDEQPSVLTLREEDTFIELDDAPPVQQPSLAFRPSASSASENNGASNEDLGTISSQMFEDYVPTPTQIEPPTSSLLPPHLRSFIHSSDELPTTSPTFGGKRLREEPSHDSVSSLEAPGIKTLRFELSQVSSTDGSGSDQVEVHHPEEPSDGSTSASLSSATPVQPTPPQLALPRASNSSSNSSGPLIIPRAYPLSKKSYIYGPAPPSTKEVIETLESQKQPRVDYTNPYYSKPSDVPRIQYEYGGRNFHLKDHSMLHTPSFEFWNRVDAKGRPIKRPKEEQEASSRKRDGQRRLHSKWEYTRLPPSRKEVVEWAKKEEMVTNAKNTVKAKGGRIIEGPTQRQGGFKFTPVNGAQEQREKQHMAVLSMELHVNTRESFLPNPKEDSIEAIFYCLQSENDDVEMNGRSPDTHVGVIALRHPSFPGEDLPRILGSNDYALEVVDSELEMIASLLDKIVDDWDPETLAGYEVHHSSWGYLLERAKEAHDWNIVADLGRMKSQSTGRFGDAQSDRWGFSQSSTLRFTGRHVLPVWRILQSDNRLQHGAFEHVAFQVLKQRTPHFSHKTLTTWYTSGNPRFIAKVFEYWRNRVEMNIEMLGAAEVIEQNCESARVFGVDFRSVRTRGSQFKVEAVMFKLAKPESFVLLSPNRVQVGHQNAAECGPLIMEPQSAFYKGPLVVLDFQSLYPSVMIAYNYCYSTCLGRIDLFKASKKFGTTTLETPPGLLELMKDHITISPNGMMFVKPYIRRSLLAKMLSELLDTRVMVKSSMKRVQDDRALTKLLNARQLALKFLANVTYGYTSATFSGRMPCVEIADAIVQTGRETLEKAIATVQSRREWGAEVVYGDTDSLFIYLPGKSKDDAFRIGHEMAETVTSMNPRPIKLKFEKVYLPCVLLAKKRYVGFKYEYPAQLEPDFDAKGIETVRRDGIAATQKMQEACLKMLFRSQDLSVIKAYLQRQWKKLLLGDVSGQDFIYAKAVKLGTYAADRKPPPGAMVAQRAIAVDPRAEPEYGERVPYILIQAAPGEAQVDRALSPEAFLADNRLRLDAFHYIQNAIIPPLARIFNLVGADITTWFKQMPRTHKVVHARSAKPGAAKVLLEEYLSSDRCRACHDTGVVDSSGLCRPCKEQPGEVMITMHSRLRAIHSRRQALRQICASCSSATALEEIECDSTDCPVLWDRKATDKSADELDEIMKLLS